MFLKQKGAKIGMALVALSVFAAPAQGATLESVLADVRAAANEGGQWTGQLAQRVWAGDMAAIRDCAFCLAGFIALLGLWQLVRGSLRKQPAQHVIALPDGQGVVETIVAPAADDDLEDAPPPMRLLEAVAAAKAQFAISEAERKRAR